MSETTQQANKIIDAMSQNIDTLQDKSKIKVFDDTLSEEELKKIETHAKEFLSFVSNKDSSEIRSILESLVIDDLALLENSSELLSAKVGHLDAIDGSSSSEISNALVKLNTEISQINPHRQNFSVNRFIAMLPFVGKPINRYLKRLKSSKEVIDEIMSHLEEGSTLLRDDNTVLQHDKKRYQEAAIQLQRKALVLEHVIFSIEENLSTLSEKERAFYENNLLLNLHKKIRSIYEVLVVTQEGILSSDLIVNTNWELVDNIANVRIVTKRALEIGVAMLVALENQKNVLDAIEKTKAVTNELLLDNAKKMNQQASDIYTKSSAATLNIDTLKEAFGHIDDAMSKIDTFKVEALTKTRDEVAKLKIITQKLEQKVEEAEKIETTKVSLSIEV